MQVHPLGRGRGVHKLAVCNFPGEGSKFIKVEQKGRIKWKFNIV